MTERAENRSETAETILAAAKTALLQVGYARLSTRTIAEGAGVPLSQIHYHFGSRENLVLALLERENERLLERQERMYASDMPLWKQWEQACDFLEDDLASGYVRVLQEMIAAGWSDETIAAAVWRQLRGWHRMLASVAGRAADRLGGLGPFTAEEAAALAALPFIGAEAYLLLGIGENEVPTRSAMRKLGDVIRAMEEAEQ